MKGGFNGEPCADAAREVEADRRVPVRCRVFGVGGPARGAEGGQFDPELCVAQALDVEDGRDGREEVNAPALPLGCGMRR